MLELRGAVAGYRDTIVLRGIDLVVPASSVVALLGPNGAGKTTVLRAATALLPLRAGELVVDGESLTRPRPDALARAGVCHIPEGRGIFPSLSVRENVLLQASPGTEAEALQLAVDAFPILGDRMKQVAGTLSGGQQQMLALARAYVTKPKVVLLDEVSMGLAPKLVDEIFAFLQRLAREGAALLLVEQYVVRALQMADYVYILNRGRVVFAGEPAEIDHENVFNEYIGAQTSARPAPR